MRRLRFGAGDVVRLRAGGAAMTVERSCFDAGDESAPRERSERAKLPREKVVCVWMERIGHDLEVCRVDFDADELEGGPIDDDWLAAAPIEATIGSTSEAATEVATASPSAA
jgi:uncharacterized protein YodC (DUF2158 family)